MTSRSFDFPSTDLSGGVERLLGDRPAGLPSASSPIVMLPLESIRKITELCCFFFSSSISEGRSAAARQSRTAAIRSANAKYRHDPEVFRNWGR